MKHVIILLITIYQKFISPLLKTLLGVRRMCLSTPTCSEFTKQAISKHGVVRGVVYGVWKIVTCNPYGKYI